MINRDGPVTPVTTTVNSSADAYVRDGTSATTNFATGDLIAKAAGTVGNNRRAFIKFDIGALTTISNAKLRLFGRLSGPENTNVKTSVFGVADSSWSETGLTWNTAPAADATAIGSGITVANVTGAWYELDLTAWLQSQKALGRTSVTLMLKNGSSTTTQSVFASRESGATLPQLVVTA